MTFDYLSHLAVEEVGNPSVREQWAGQYHQFIAVGKKKGKADPLREEWKSQYLCHGQAPGEVIAKQEWQYTFGLSPNPEALSLLDNLPTHSFLVCLTFVLRKPYLSKDNTDFHIIDNPIVREKVFRWPMVRPTGWKGALRHALWQLGFLGDEQSIQQLFGEVNAADDAGQAGRLHFFPTFFAKTSLEIINPHDRVRRVGKNPILFESVPIGATGTFTLLYVPFDRIGKDARKTRREVAEDLALVAQGLKAMFTTYGFGAKTSSGFGVAEEAFIKDAQGKSQAIIRVKGGKAYRYRSFAGLCQAAEKLAKELSDAA